MANFTSQYYFYATTPSIPGDVNVSLTDLTIHQKDRNGFNYSNELNVSTKEGSKITVSDENGNFILVQYVSGAITVLSEICTIPVTILNQSGVLLAGSPVVVCFEYSDIADAQTLTNKTLTDATNACRATQIYEVEMPSSAPTINQKIKTTAATTSGWVDDVLTGLNDVSVTAPTYGQILGYNTATSQFENDNLVWQDLIGLVSVRSGGGANAPIIRSFQGVQYEYSCNNGLTYVYFLYHMPHDWKVGSDLYIHLHHASNTADAGTAIFDVISSVAKINSAFNTDVTAVPISHTGFVQYQHNVTEILFATAGGGANLQDTANIDVDSLIQVRLSRNTGAIGDDAGGNNIFILQMDIHYQSDGRVGTKNKTAPFNT